LRQTRVFQRLGVVPELVEGGLRIGWPPEGGFVAGGGQPERSAAAPAAPASQASRLSGRPRSPGLSRKQATRPRRVDQVVDKGLRGARPPAFRLEPAAGRQPHAHRGGCSRTQIGCGKGRQQQLAGPIKAAQLGARPGQLERKAARRWGSRAAQPRSLQIPAPPETAPPPRALPPQPSTSGPGSARQVAQGGQKALHIGCWPEPAPFGAAHQGGCSPAPSRSASGVKLAAAAAAPVCGGQGHVFQTRQPRASKTAAGPCPAPLAATGKARCGQFQAQLKRRAAVVHGGESE